MPLFNYKCEICSSKFEELVRSSSDKVSCPNCKSELVKKVLPSKLSTSAKSPSSSTGFS